MANKGLEALKEALGREEGKMYYHLCDYFLWSVFL
jgi:hypothetical protein